jgi:energy-coupling factor transport system ATP-binding protein
MIEIEEVTYSYPGATRPALRDLNLRIEQGEFVLVAGPSGAGKSTLLRTLNGLVPHFYGGSWHGRVRIDGRDTRTHEPRALSDLVGFVFQDPEAQMVVEIVEDELVFGMENLGLDPRIMRRRVEEVLDLLEIAPLRRRRLTTLSGGERQRVAIAAVLTMQPQVLVLDEPTSQLDPHSAEEVLTALQKLNADLGLTIVLSEHRLERVVQYVDRIIFCRDHNHEPQVVDGPPAEILETAPFAPPLVELARALGWRPLPLTIKAGRRYVAELDLPQRPQREGTPSLKGRGAKAPPPAGEGFGVTSPKRLNPALAVSGLGVRLGGRDVLRGVNLAIHDGEIVAIMGRNGSGKTTLLRTIMGLLEPAQGRVTVDGHEITRLPTEERSIFLGYVPQDPRTLLFHPTLQEELAWTQAQGSGTRAAQDIWQALIHEISARESSSGQPSRQRSFVSHASCCSTSQPVGSTTSVRTGCLGSSRSYGSGVRLLDW